MLWTTIILLQHIGGTFAGLFESLYPEEGEYQALYPIVSLGLYLQEEAHVLPYLFGYLENIDYPKDRIFLDVYVNNRVDSTLQKTKWWLKKVGKLYRETRLVEKGDNWRESALRNARLYYSSYILLFTGKHFFMDMNLVQKLISQKRFINSPYLLELNLLEPVLFYHYNTSSDTTSSFKVRDVPLFIDLTHSDISYVTFSAENLFNYVGNSDPWDVFTYSLSRLGSVVYVNYSEFYGVDLGCEGCSLDTERKQMNSFVATVISKFGLHALSISAFIDVQYPRQSKFKMAQIYVINLKRRIERRKKVEKLLRLLGFEYQVWDATDGNNLKEEPMFDEVTLLSNYEDPYYKRPMKAGEVGCFLSHYRIWKDVVLNNYSRVIVFEDDLRFAMDGIDRLVELIEDLDLQNFQWDLVYLGRKQLDNSKEHWIKAIRHLSTVGYSYWTIGYMLSLTGAQKLLQNEPLKKLLPVDEYIPIMFNRHPNKTWMEKFEKRDLSAFTVFPVVVHPEKYTTDAGYVSDTEDSPFAAEQKYQTTNYSNSKAGGLSTDSLTVGLTNAVTFGRNEL